MQTHLLSKTGTDGFSMAWLWPLPFNQGGRGNAVILLFLTVLWVSLAELLHTGVPHSGPGGFGTDQVGYWLHHSPHRHLAARKCAETTVWISSPLPISRRSTALNFFALGWVLWTGLLLKSCTPFLLPSLPHTHILSFPPRAVLPHNAAGKKKGWLTPDLFERCF